MESNKLFSLEGKVALVTGAAYGIGFAIAEAYAVAGAKIAFNCRGQEHMDKALADYTAKGIEARGYICDVTDEAQVEKMVADIEKELGTVDILVNNAGIIKRIPMTEMKAEEFRQVIDIDLNAPFIVSKAVIPGMIQKGHGKIINICSMMSELGRETVSAYAAAKGGLKMLTKILPLSTVSTISSVTASDPVISQPLRQHLLGKNSRTEADILLTSSLLPKLLRPAGEPLRISWDRQFSWHPMRLILSMAIFSTWTAASWHT